MPELPEVETTCSGISPHITGKRVSAVVVRDRRLRWPVTPGLEESLTGQRILSVSRRGKYLLLETPAGHVMIHLGMSGSLRIVKAAEPARKHDHVDICFGKNTVLRFHDPRRFGCVLWLDGDPLLHPLLAGLGPEPLGGDFDTAYLFARSRGRATPVKSFIMDSCTVVGVGNIYANESLFMAGIDPRRRAGSISRARYDRLVTAIRQVLGQAIAVGGTTLRDFVGGDGKPGYFAQSLLVYGRAGEPCKRCGRALTEIRMSQRSTVFCRHCQT